jgi:hypothetical protein
MTTLRILLSAFALILAIPAAAIDLSSHDIVIPVVGQTPGANQTNWQTDLSVGNPDRHLPVDVDIAFHADGDPNPQFAQVTIEPRGVVSFRAVIASLFGRDTGSGFIRITTVNPAQRAWARARIYNFSYQLTQNGTVIPVEFGQAAPAIPYDMLSRRVLVAPLPGDQGNRSNAGITNPNPFDVNVFVSWFEGDGVNYGGVSITVPANSVYRINDVFAWTGRPYDVPLTLEASADAPIYFWGSVVRNENGDATFLVGVRGEQD